MGKVSEFYRNKNVLITGATGFCGKALVEKLLRACDGVKKIYVLAREKKNASAQQRLKTYLNENVFEHVKKINPDSLDKIVFIDGDISIDDLNLGYQDQHELIQNVNIVFHCAATINFNNNIDIALNTNVHGLKRVANFSLKMKNLESFVYMSTVFSHCYQTELGEQHYETGLNVDEICKKADSLEPDNLMKYQEKLLKDTKYPNTYALSKGLAEDVAETYKDVLPIVVIRPSIVFSAKDSPLEGWIDGIHSGATGIVAGSMTGLVRSMYCGETVKCQFTPVDFVANATIVCAYKRAMSTFKGILYINCVDSKDNQVTWKQSIQKLNKVNKVCVPQSRLLWYPNIVPTSNYYWHLICLLLFQLIPAILVDTLRMIQGKKKYMFKLQKRIITGISVLYYFTTTDFEFGTTKLKEMFDELDESDKKTFNFNHNDFNWDDTLRNYCYGVRKFLMKEGSETTPEAQRKLKNFYYLDVAVKGLFSASMIYGIFLLI